MLLAADVPVDPTPLGPFDIAGLILIGAIVVYMMYRFQQMGWQAEREGREPTKPPAAPPPPEQKQP